MSSSQFGVGAIAMGALLAPLVVACASDTSTNTRSAPNTETGGSSSQGSGGRATGGARSAGASGSGATAGAGGNRSSGGAAGGDASPTAGGAGGNNTGGGFGVRPEVDAGPEPPSYCVAPCVWDVVKHCIPLMRQCSVDPIGQGLGSMTCDTTTGWSSRYESVSPRTYRTTLAWHGTTCVSWVTSYVISLAGATSLYDASGNPVAFVMGDIAYCGAQMSDLAASSGGGGTITDAGLVYGDGRVLPAVHLKRGNPECAAWGALGFPAGEICQSVDDGGTCQ